MNVKIAEDSLTFKISEEELKILLSGTALEKKVMIGHNAFTMAVDPLPHESFDDAQEKPLKLILDRKESCLLLCTSMDDIQKLSDMGKSRDGLSAHIDGLDVFLQVDVRKDSRGKIKHDAS